MESWNLDLFKNKKTLFASVFFFRMSTVAFAQNNLKQTLSHNFGEYQKDTVCHSLISALTDSDCIVSSYQWDQSYEEYQDSTKAVLSLVISYLDNQEVKNEELSRNNQLNLQVAVQLLNKLELDFEPQIELLEEFSEAEKKKMTILYSQLLFIITK